MAVFHVVFVWFHACRSYQSTPLPKQSHKDHSHEENLDYMKRPAAAADSEPSEDKVRHTTSNIVLQVVKMSFNRGFEGCIRIWVCTLKTAWFVFRFRSPFCRRGWLHLKGLQPPHPHFKHTSHICLTYVAHMSHICRTHVAHLSHICRTYVAHMSHICRTYVANVSTVPYVLCYCFGHNKCNDFQKGSPLASCTV